MFFMQNRTMRMTAVLVTLAFVCLQVLAAFPQQALAGNEDDLKTIQYKYYFRGNYDKAITEFRVYLERNDLTNEQVVTAREYLAASLIMTGASDQAKAQYLKILNEDGSYAGPDPSVFKTVVIDTYQEAQAEYASAVIRNVPETVVATEGTTTPGETAKVGKPIYKKWWFYVAMGAVLLVVAGAAGGSAGEEDGPPAQTGTVTIGVDVQ